jgi:hypothetical protein
METDDLFLPDSPEDDKTAAEHGRVQLFFYVAHRPQGLPEINLESITLDGVDAKPLKKVELPAKQGFSVFLGGYEPNRTVELRWKFRTGIITAPVEVSIGVYRNTLRNRSEFQRITIDTFQNHEGLASVQTLPSALNQ